MMRTTNSARKRSHAAVDEHERRPVVRGRPRLLDDVARRERLVAAAEHVFVEMGYSAASMDGIARRAGMSKKTIYQVFETKHELFAAVIDSRRNELAAMIQAERSDEMMRPDDVLKQFLTQIARFVLAPRQ